MKYKVTGILPGCNGLAGGIGNHFFLIASILVTAWELDLEPIFRFDPMLKYSYHNDYRQGLLKHLTFREDDLSTYTTIKEQDLIEGTIPQDVDVVIEGYCQNPKIFIKYGDRLRKYLTQPYEEVESIVQSLRTTYTDKKIVIIQVRRGDYINLGWNLPLTYYENAQSHFNDVVFLITTDDTDYCKQHFSYDILSCSSDVIEFFVLSRMDGCILSNSTFGWWSAYIGNQTDVVLPFPWFKHRPYNQNLYIDGWIKQEY
jgi:hypothetical protein